MTISWRDDYLQALDERDQREKSNLARVDDQLIAACKFTSFFWFRVIFRLCICSFIVC